MEQEKNESIILDLKKKSEIAKSNPSSLKMGNLDSEIKFLKEKIDVKIESIPMSDKTKKAPEKSEVSFLFGFVLNN
jgi:hypothetical protein